MTVKQYVIVAVPVTNSVFGCDSMMLQIHSLQLTPCFSISLLWLSFIFDGSCQTTNVFLGFTADNDVHVHKAFGNSLVFNR